MKSSIIVLYLVFFIGGFSIHAFQTDSASGNLSEDLEEYNPFYDYMERRLYNSDTIPGYESKNDKLKISGTIYMSDGVTPAKDVILYIEQADEHGDFELKGKKEKRYVHNRGWIKTNADGQYTFYTYVPGNDRRYNQFQQLFPIIKEPSKPAYHIASLLFDQDPLLTKNCRKRMAKKGDPSRILKLKEENGIFTVQKDIVLYEAIIVSK